MAAMQQSESVSRVTMAVETDAEGYLCRLDAWNEAVAQQIALAEGITLTAEHWQIIHLLRDFYRRYQQSPAMRPLVNFIARELGPEQGRSIHLLRLFPGSPARLAAKIAGLPKPTHCL